MIKSLALTLTLSIASASLTHAWAPPSRLEPSVLPKALTFANNAWHSPQKTTIAGGSGMLTWRPEETTVKRPWTQKTAVVDASDHYYFDGVTGTPMQWPSASPAFVPKTTALSMGPPRGFVEECVDEYYDISGEPLCWISTRRGLDLEEIALDQHQKEDKDYSYFDETGERVWRDYEAISTTAKQESLSSVSELNEEVSDEYFAYHW